MPRSPMLWNWPTKAGSCACQDNAALRAGLAFAKGYLTFLPTAKAQNRTFTPAAEAIAILAGR